VSTNRAEILSRFEQWLDRTLMAEEPPSGLDADVLALISSNVEPPSDELDSYALWAAVTGLTQEIKLQGRAFQELNRTMEGQAARIGAELRTEHRERERDLQKDAERRGRKQLLNILIDVQDRMERGLEAGRIAREKISATTEQGWLARLLHSAPPAGATDVVSALIQGYELSMERIAQALSDADAQLIHCKGVMFDPKRMNAIDRAESRDIPSGTVLEVYRNGYEWNGEVLRPAQVKVSYAPESGERGE
jgi:molecular chaperone GrpE